MSNSTFRINLPLISDEDIPPLFDASQYVVPVLNPKEISEVDGVKTINISDEEGGSLSSYKIQPTLKPSNKKTIIAPVNNVPSSSLGIPSSSQTVNEKEAEYLILNAHMAYLAAEKASSCRIHAESNGATCEMLQHTQNELRNYISTLQKQLLNAKKEKDEIQRQKMDIEHQHSELKRQYTIVIERGLNAKTALDEARKYKEEYEKSQAVLLDVLNTYSNLKDKYSEAIKIASTFAKERDEEKNKHYSLNYDISSSSEDDDNAVLKALASPSSASPIRSPEKVVSNNIALPPADVPSPGVLDSVISKNTSNALVKKTIAARKRREKAKEKAAVKRQVKAAAMPPKLPAPRSPRKKPPISRKPVISPQKVVEVKEKINENVKIDEKVQDDKSVTPAAVSMKSPPTEGPTTRSTTIHGRKGITVREQQNQMKGRATDVIKQLKAQYSEKLTAPKPPPKKPTASRVPKRQRPAETSQDSVETRATRAKKQAIVDD